MQLLKPIPVWTSAVRMVLVAAALILSARVAPAQLTDSNVLVLYNSAGPATTSRGMSDSEAIFQYYRQLYPNVVGLDLADAQLTPGNISYADFSAKIRDPVRAFLGPQGLAQQVSTVMLTKDLPHRILDVNRSTVGDVPVEASTLFDSSNITYASVDSELTLLWQDLLVGENNAAFDSHADMLVSNPYHNQRQSIMSYDRSLVTQTLTFHNYMDEQAAWLPMRNNDGSAGAVAGSIYLTGRLDGGSVNDVMRMIDRGRAASFRGQTDALLLDESPPGSLDAHSILNGNSLGNLGDDYDRTAEQLGGRYPRLVFDEGGNFLVGSGPGYTGTAPTQVITGNVAALGSYGGNHDRGTGAPSNNGFMPSFAGQLVDGAVMNTIESYNGRSLGGLSAFSDQGDVVSWIAAGGSFAIGHVWEPFAFSVADNEVLFDELTRGRLTWIEAAWSSIPWLSWQHVAVGDPLARPTPLNSATALAVWTGATASEPLPAAPVVWNDPDGWTRGGLPNVSPRQGDHLQLQPASGVGSLVNPASWITESISVTGMVSIQAPIVAVRTGLIDVSPASSLTVMGDLLNGRGLIKTGEGALEVHGVTSDLRVQAGVHSGSGMRTSLQIDPLAMLLVEQPLVVRETLSVAPEGHIVWQPSEPSDQPLLTIWQSANVAGVAEVNTDTIAANLPQRGTIESVALLAALDGAILPNAVVVSAQSGAVQSVVPTSGVLTHINNGLFAGFVSTPYDLSMKVMLAAEGDVDGDLDVDVVDQLLLFEGWTGAENPDLLPTGWTLGDFDGDFDTDTSDLLTLMAGWTGASSGATLGLEPLGWNEHALFERAPPSAIPAAEFNLWPATSERGGHVSAVPEPGLALLPMAVAAAWARASRSRRRR